ncbi:MAG: hypothetical protein MZV63_17975 [Marinilabiliales bacterium]|nr:hypothetical protein [Marinilabiliales bacterium]
MGIYCGFAAGVMPDDRVRVAVPLLCLVAVAGRSSGIVLLSECDCNGLASLYGVRRFLPLPLNEPARAMTASMM